MSNSLPKKIIFIALALISITLSAQKSPYKSAAIYFKSPKHKPVLKGISVPKIAFSKKNKVKEINVSFTADYASKDSLLAIILSHSLDSFIATHNSITRGTFYLKRVDSSSSPNSLNFYLNTTNLIPENRAVSQSLNTVTIALVNQKFVLASSFELYLHVSADLSKKKDKPEKWRYDFMTKAEYDSFDIQRARLSHLYRKFLFEMIMALEKKHRKA